MDSEKQWELGCWLCISNYCPTTTWKGVFCQHMCRHMNKLEAVPSVNIYHRWVHPPQRMSTGKSCGRANTCSFLFRKRKKSSLKHRKGKAFLWEWSIMRTRKKRTDNWWLSSKKKKKGLHETKQKYYKGMFFPLNTLDYIVVIIHLYYFEFQVLWISLSVFKITSIFHFLSIQLSLWLLRAAC